MEFWLGAIHLILGLVICAMFVLVLHSNRRHPLNRSFAFFLAMVLIWSVLNLASNLTQLSLSDLLFINHVLLAFSSMVIVALLHFCVELLEVPNKTKYQLTTLGVGGIGAFLALTPWVIENVSRQVNVVALSFGPLAWVYFLIIIGMSLTVFGLLIATLFQQEGVKKERAIVLLSSLAVTVAFVLVTNVILPVTTGNFTLSVFAPIFPIFLLIGAGYSIVRHRLFDVRIIAARSLAYILSISLLVGVYSAIVYGIIGNTFELSSTDTFTKGVYVGSAILLAITFGPIKRFFDLITDKVFFRNEYNPQDTLHKLSNIVANQINLKKITTESLSVVTEALKCEFAAAVIFPREKGARKDAYQFHTGKRSLAHEALYGDGLLDLLQTTNLQIIIPEGVTNKALRAKMEEGEVALALRLETSRELVGYLFLGEKQNGTIYNNKDIRMLSTIGHEVGLAIQNSLRFFEIQNFNETLQQRIEEATKELRETNKKLRALDIAKDEFISMASHQLRTPLTSVKGYISMVLDGDGGPLKPEQRKLLSEAYGSSQRMVYLIADFLNVSRIRTGKFVLEPKPVRLTDIIKGEIRQLAVTAENRGLDLEYSAPEHFPTLLLDEEKTRQVIMNFIDNAIYYTPPGGKICVTLMVTHKEIVFKVTDTGIGIPKSEQHKLFTKFYRASNARQMRPDGTGIGLFLAKKVVALQGGAIIFESKAGKGSVFGFSFPRRNALPDKTVDHPAH